jgi:[FeFe] hydrogenase H-cluster maturation GTPase HydF
MSHTTNPTNLKSMRWHIGVFGRTNTGKSTFINWLSNQSVSIVSPEPGTTTDPVEKVMEILPLGPVVLIDTAGFDDETLLGKQRIEKTNQIFSRIDIALLISDANNFGSSEKEWITRFQDNKIPFLVVINQIDRYPSSPHLLKWLHDQNIPLVEMSSIHSDDTVRTQIKTELHKLLPDQKWVEKPLLEGLVKKGDLVVLLIPIDKSAPKGRIILPQQQVIREVIDQGGLSLTIVPEQIPLLTNYLKDKPALMITDSQAFEAVFRLSPPEIPITSFSILFARQRGEFETLLRGAYSLRNLKAGDKVLVMEACSHHPTVDDIGRVKIPNWLKRYVGAEIKTNVVCGHTIPEDLSSYKAVIHCGSCMMNRREVVSRIQKVSSQGVAITNYGLAIAEMNGYLDRAVQPIKNITTEDKSEADHR